MRETQEAGDLGAQPEIVRARLAVGERRRPRSADAENRPHAARVVAPAEREADVAEPAADRGVEHPREVLCPFLDVAFRLGRKPVAPADVLLPAASAKRQRPPSSQERNAFERAVARKRALVGEELRPGLQVEARLEAPGDERFQLPGAEQSPVHLRDPKVAPPVMVREKDEPLGARIPHRRPVRALRQRGPGARIEIAIQEVTRRVQLRAKGKEKPAYQGVFGQKPDAGLKYRRAQPIESH